MPAVGKSRLRIARSDRHNRPCPLIKELVQQDKLSPYQANVLYRGLSHPLQLGKLRVTRSLETQRGDYWYEGEDAASARWSAFPPKAVWMVAIPDEKLVEPQIRINT